MTIETFSEDRVLEWEEYALGFIESGQKDSFVRLQLRRMDCPPEIAHALVEQCRKVVAADHRQRGLSMLVGGAAVGLPLLYVVASSFSGAGIGGYVLRGPGLIFILLGAVGTLSTALLGAFKMVTGSVALPKED